MKFIKNIGKMFGIIPENKTEEIREQRNKILDEMARKLTEVGFTKEEIDEVLNIQIESEKKIQEQKDLLIGTNINNPEPAIIMKEIMTEIRYLEEKAAKEMRAKIAEIRQKRGI